MIIVFNKYLYGLLGFWVTAGIAAACLPPCALVLSAECDVSTPPPPRLHPHALVLWADCEVSKAPNPPCLRPCALVLWADCEVSKAPPPCFGGRRSS